jgi:hypothetical protein
MPTTTNTTMKAMKTLCTRSGVRLGGVALLALTTAATACTGRQQETPPATTTAESPSAADTPIPDTASPLDALPEAVRLVADKPSFCVRTVSDAPGNPGKHGQLRTHIEELRCRVKSLRESVLMRVGVRYCARAVSISKRA